MRKDHTIKMEEIRGHQVIELVPLGRLNKAVIASCLPQHQKSRIASRDPYWTRKEMHGSGTSEWVKLRTPKTTQCEHCSSSKRETFLRILPPIVPTPSETYFMRYTEQANNPKKSKSTEYWQVVKGLQEEPTNPSKKSAPSGTARGRVLM